MFETGRSRGRSDDANAKNRVQNNIFIMGARKKDNKYPWDVQGIKRKLVKTPNDIIFALGRLGLKCTPNYNRKVTTTTRRRTNEQSLMVRQTDVETSIHSFVATTYKTKQSTKDCRGEIYNDAEGITVLYVCVGDHCETTTYTRTII